MFWHLTLATVDRSRIWSTDGELAGLLRGMGRVGGRSLLLFCVVDDHVHLVCRGSRAEAGRLARRLAVVVGSRPGGRMAPTDIRAVSGRPHLYGLVEYVPRQPVRHGLGVHPAGWPERGVRKLARWEVSAEARRAVHRLLAIDSAIQAAPGSTAASFSQNLRTRTNRSFSRSCAMRISHSCNSSA